MFGLFKQKKTIQVKDFVWKTENAKYTAMCNYITTLEKCVLIYFFEDTKQQLIEQLQKHTIQFTEQKTAAVPVLLIKYTEIMATPIIKNSTIIFIEHHPSFNVEKNTKDVLYNNLSIKEVQFYTSFDDKLLQLFGAERILNLMEKMGFKEDEVIEHNMVSQSIEKAQQKIDTEVLYASDTRNRLDWFKINLPMKDSL